MRLDTLLIALCSLPAVLGATTAAQPSVQLDQGFVRGKRDIVDGVKLDKFLGVPFAQAPVGNLRFARPKALAADKHVVIEATQSGPACLQTGNATMSEDCLSLDIVRPAGVPWGVRLPVVQWIYGGAFQTGSTAMYNLDAFVAASVKLGHPVIAVNANYRLGGFGFMGGKDFVDAVDQDPEATTLNAGTWDQRFALQWTQANIAKFGGDVHKVLLLGQSAGAISIGLHLQANGGRDEGLFSAALMLSGTAGGTAMSPSHPRVTATYANVTAAVGCPTSGAISLSCLRSVDAAKLSAAINVIQGSFAVAPLSGALAWGPGIDGFFMPDRGTVTINAGRIIDVPIAAGTCQDEGPTLVAPSALSNSASFEAWFTSLAVVQNTTARETVLQRLFELYPDVPALGSPYSNAPVGVNGSISQASATPDSRLFPPLATSNFKRGASIFGDFTFNGARRFFLSTLARSSTHKSPIWAYVFRQSNPGLAAYLGTPHGADLPYILGGLVRGRPADAVGIHAPLQEDMQRLAVGFAHFHDPRALLRGASREWPTYLQGSAGEQGTLKQWKGDNVTLVADDFRKEQLAYFYEKDTAGVLAF